MRILLSLATAITILAVALLLLFTPVWTHFALDAVGNGSANLISDSDQTINEVLFGPGSFEINPCGAQPGCSVAPSTQSPSFYTDDEKGHMRDVRVVLYGFLLIALALLVFVVATILRTPRDPTRWRAISRGGSGLMVGVIAVGVFGLVAFDTAFTLFHEIFFPGGNWAFPADSNLIGLYPEPFWELSAAALGVLAAGGGIAIWFLARRRAAALEAV